MLRPDMERVPAFYQTYVTYVQDMDLLAALRHAGKMTQAMLVSIPEDWGTYRYAEGKWSLKEVLNHMMDAERVFAYRALRFSRNDKTPLHPFDENAYAPLANAHSRTLYQLARELQWLRETTIDLYSSFTPDMLAMEGIASDQTLSVLNLGYIIAGHDLHHQRILKERYLNR